MYVFVCVYVYIQKYKYTYMHFYTYTFLYIYCPLPSRNADKSAHYHLSLGQHTKLNTLKDTATCCNALYTERPARRRFRIVSLHWSKCAAKQHRNFTATYCNTLHIYCLPTLEQLQHTATHCNILQHTATHCNTLQHTATYIAYLHSSKHALHRSTAAILEGPGCNTLQQHCSTMQHTAATLQHNATHCSNTAAQCNTLCNTLHVQCLHLH